MAQTFDIRFARSAGFAALLEVPENRFRWKGGGLLRIDSRGISIGVKRSLLALLGGKRTQRIPTDKLRAVYREGEALRVEYQSGSANVVLPFWADNSDAAAQIVRMLPTSQTVEIEHSTDATRGGKPRADWRVLLSLTTVFVVLFAGGWLLFQRTKLPVAVAAAPASEPAAPDSPLGSLPMPDATASLVDAAEPSVEQGTPASEPPMSPPVADAAGNGPAASPDFLEPPEVVLSVPGPLPLPRDYVRSGDFVIPIRRGTDAHEIARREIASFERQATELESEFRLQRDLLNAGALTPVDLIAKLNAFELRWWDVTFRIFDNDALAAPSLLDVRATMLAAARLWRSFLATYAEGLRTRDSVLIASAFDELARAQEMQSRARLFVR